MHCVRARPTDGTAAPTAGQLRRDGGYSVIEVLVSMTLFMGLAAAIVMLLLTSLNYAESNDNRVIAAGLAAAQVEQARAVDPPSALSAATTTVVRDGTTFTIKRVLLPVTGCSSPGNTRTITVSVSWTGSSVTSDTMRAC